PFACTLLSSPELTYLHPGLLESYYSTLIRPLLLLLATLPSRSRRRCGAKRDQDRIDQRGCDARLETGLRLDPVKDVLHLVLRSARSRANYDIEGASRQPRVTRHGEANGYTIWVRPI